MRTIHYVGVGPNTKRTFIVCGVKFTDGIGDVPEDIHKSAGHLLKDTYGVMPASELPVVDGGRDANGDGEADVGPKGGKLEDARPDIGEKISVDQLTPSEHPGMKKEMVEVPMTIQPDDSATGEASSKVIETPVEKPVKPVRNGKRK